MKAPNLHKVVMPDCCGTCEHFKRTGDEYEDSPEGCYEFVVDNVFGYDSLCDAYKRDRRYLTNAQ